MSTAAATYTLGAEEVFQCHKCGKLYHGDDDMEVIVDPDRGVEIRCENCPSEEN